MLKISGTHREAPAAAASKSGVGGGGEEGGRGYKKRARTKKQL